MGFRLVASSTSASDKDNVAQIQVTIAVDTNLVEIKTDARAFLETNILSGVSTIQVRGGTQQARVLKAEPNHKYPIIKAGQNELEEVKASLPALVGDLKQASQRLNLLLDERNRQAVADTLQNLRTLPRHSPTTAKMSASFSQRQSA